MLFSPDAPNWLFTGSQITSMTSQLSTEQVPARTPSIPRTSFNRLSCLGNSTCRVGGSLSLRLSMISCSISSLKTDLGLVLCAKVLLFVQPAYEAAKIPCYFRKIPTVFFAILAGSVGQALQIAFHRYLSSISASKRSVWACHESSQWSP